MRLLLLIISLLAYSTGILAQQDLEMDLVHDGEDRNFLFYIPSSYADVGQAMPLVFSFHGFTSNATQQRLYSDMNGVAEEEGFIVCYPNGIDASWNVGAFFGSSADDIGFTGAMIDTLSSLYNINLGRVYACGMSNGGYFSYRLACEMSDRIAAVASVTGTFSPFMMENCEPSRKVPVMEVHGTDDQIVPYDGQIGSAEPIEEVIAFWVDHNSCIDTFVLIDIPDTDPDDGSTVRIHYYQQCEDDTEVLFAIVDGGGHTWPGTSISVGSTNQDYDASQEIWNFFQKHKIDALSTNSEIEYPAFEIYPNPTSNVINLDARVRTYTLYSIKGKFIERSNQHTVDLEHLQSGMYLLQLESKGVRLTKKVIKK